MEYKLAESSIDVSAPLIYMWEIRNSSEQVIGRYIGKANGGDKRPTRHYSRNVNKLLAGKQYKKGKNYRRVHFALADAVERKHSITLSYLCNVPQGQDIFKVENRYIREYLCDADDGVGLNGRWKGEERRVLPRTVDIPIALDKVLDERHLLDLEDFLEYVESAYADRYKIESGAGRYSLFIKDEEKKGGKGPRILRALQSGPSGKVYIKLAQTALKAKDKVAEFPWDGSEEQIDMAIEGELRFLAK